MAALSNIMYGAFVPARLDYYEGVPPLPSLSVHLHAMSTQTLFLLPPGTYVCDLTTHSPVECPLVKD